MGMCIWPGTTVLTRMPFVAYSAAVTRPNWMRITVGMGAPSGWEVRGPAFGQADIEGVQRQGDERVGAEQADELDDARLPEGREGGGAQRVRDGVVAMERPGAIVDEAGLGSGRSGFRRVAMASITPGAIPASRPSRLWTNHS